MELFILLVMVMAGVALAALFLIAASIARHERTAADARGALDREHLVSSILFEILTLGGATETEALDLIGRLRGPLSPFTRGIDLFSWGEAFAVSSSLAQREALLDLAVRGALARGQALSQLQYSALLNLTFALGFHSNTLALLQAKYGFSFLKGSAAFSRRPGVATAPDELFAVLGLRPDADRRSVISSYRRLAAIYHPDRLHGGGDRERKAASDRFIEITDAYERLLAGQPRH